MQRILWVVFILNLLGLAELTVLYFGGPGWLQQQLPKVLEKQIGRPVQLTQVRVEPLSLKLILQGLEIREAVVSETFVSLEEIGIDPLNKLANSIVIRDTGRPQCIELVEELVIEVG